MAFIETVAEQDAEGPVAEIYAADRAAMGYVPNYTQVFSQNPAIYEAWRELNGAIKGSMSLRLYELATVAAAQELRSSYCSLAHGTVLATKVLDRDTAHAVLVDGRLDALTPAERGAMELARQVVADATAVTEADVERLRGLGLSDADIFAVVTAAAARCFMSKTTDALGASPDAAYNAMEPELREALTVGRPIEDA